MEPPRGKTQSVVFVLLLPPKVIGFDSCKERYFFWTQAKRSNLLLYQS
jgi:hypothetical protein